MKKIVASLLVLLLSCSVAAAQVSKPPLPNVAGPTTSAQFSGIITDETGTGAVVLGTDPTVSITSTGSTTGRTLQARFADVRSVLDYGAACNGSTDDTTAIQAALNTGKPVSLPAASCRITEALNVPSGGALIGVGPASQLLVNSDQRGVYTGGTNVLLASFRVTGSGSAVSPQNGRAGIHVEGTYPSPLASNVTISDVIVENVRSTGISISASDKVSLTNFIVSNTYEHGFYAAATTNLTVSNGVIKNAGQLGGSSSAYGFKISGGSDISASNIQIRNPLQHGVVLVGPTGQSAARIHLSNVSANSNGSSISGLLISGTVDTVTVDGGVFEGSYGGSAQIDDDGHYPTNLFLNGVTFLGDDNAFKNYGGAGVYITGGFYGANGTALQLQSTAGATYANAVTLSGANGAESNGAGLHLMGYQYIGSGAPFINTANGTQNDGRYTGVWAGTFASSTGSGAVVQNTNATMAGTTAFPGGTTIDGSGNVLGAGGVNVGASSPLTFGGFGGGTHIRSSTNGNIKLYYADDITPAAVTIGAWQASQVAVAYGGTNCTSASGTCLDNITGFSSTGFIKRTGAGTYTFTADPSDVTTVFGRSGAVVAAANDYNFNQLAGNWTLAQGPTIGATTVLGSVAGGVPAALTQTQLTALINPATASLSGALPAWPNNTTTFLRGDGTYATLNVAAVSGAAPIASPTFTGTATAPIYAVNANGSVSAPAIGYGTSGLYFSGSGGIMTAGANGAAVVSFCTGATILAFGATCGTSVPGLTNQGGILAAVHADNGGALAFSAASFGSGSVDGAAPAMKFGTIVTETCTLDTTTDWHVSIGGTIRKVALCQ